MPEEWRRTGKTEPGVREYAHSLSDMGDSLVAGERDQLVEEGKVEEMILRSLRLAFFISMRYRGRSEIMDIVQETSLRMLEQAKRGQPVIVKYCVATGARNSFLNDRTIQIPRSQLEKMQNDGENETTQQAEDAINMRGFSLAFNEIDEEGLDDLKDALQELSEEDRGIAETYWGLNGVEQMDKTQMIKYMSGWGKVKLKNRIDKIFAQLRRSLIQSRDQ